MKADHTERFSRREEVAVMATDECVLVPQRPPLWLPVVVLASLLFYPLTAAGIYLLVR